MSAADTRLTPAELLRLRLIPVISGRDPPRLAALDKEFPGLDVRAADLSAVPAAAVGAPVVVNCAGPFADTAVPVATAVTCGSPAGAPRPAARQRQRRRSMRPRSWSHSAPRT